MLGFGIMSPMHSAPTPITHLDWHTAGTLLSPDAEIIDNGLERSNQLTAPLNLVRPILCTVRKDGALLGGARGRMWGTAAELQQLWVTEAQRGQGIGSELVRRFEAFASERGCRTFYLETFSFQAPTLYKRLGYKQAAGIDGFPDGIRKMLMIKKL